MQEVEPKKVSFPAGEYPGSLGKLEVSESERYNMITFVPDDGPATRYTWYFLPVGKFDGTSAELREPLAVK